MFSVAKLLNATFNNVEYAKSPIEKTILTRLDAAESAQAMNQPGYGFHSLSGNLEGFYAVKVSGNYRIIFRFEGENAHDVDYIDYH